jgi:broad specificity phosphatase PhoE
VSRLVVVRHGRTVANAAGLLCGHLDVELDDLGRRQADASATEVLRRWPEVAAVVTSPLQRTRDTAAAFGLPFEVDDRFIELDYGELDGVPVADVAREDWARWRSDPDYAPPGGESLSAVGARVREGCREWAERAAGGTVVVVTHVSPIKAAVGWALGVGEVTAWRTRVDTASITTIETGPVGEPVLTTFNETAHLAGL